MGIMKFFRGSKRTHRTKRERGSNESCSTIRPLVPYFGGKTKVACKIISKFPKHDTYVEPFVGGGSIYWKNNKAKKFVINDKNKAIVNLYKTAKNRPSKIERCKVRVSKGKFSKLKKKNNLSACETIQMQKNSFGGDQSGGYAKKHSYGTPQVSEEHKKKLSKTRIINKDYRVVMRSHDKKGSLIYLDPPYVEQGKQYKINGVTAKEVCDSVRKVKHAHVVLSYDNNKEVRNACKGLKIKKLFVPYTAQGGENKGKTELLIANYKI